MDRGRYNRLTFVQKEEFWEYIRDVMYYAGNELLYGDLDTAEYDKLLPAQKSTWWLKFDSEFDKTFIPTSFVDKPTFWDGQGVGTEETTPTPETSPSSATTPTSEWNPPKHGGVEDVMNAAQPPNIGKPENPTFNIDDPSWMQADWEGKELTLALPPSHLLEQSQDPCLAKCQKIAQDRQRHCDIVRKRVAMALWKAGCPSNVTAAGYNNNGCL